MRLSATTFAVCLFLPACSSSSAGEGEPQGQTDAAAHDATQDVVTEAANEGGAAETGSGEGGVDAGGDSGGDASDAACPSSWFVAPGVDPSIAVPVDGGGVLIHASGNGSQNYTCTAPADGGATAWTFTGPSAALSDCTGTVIGHHMASDAGAGFPEWITIDETYVVAKKEAAFTPDGGAASVPWLLLQAVNHGGSGTLSLVDYVQRLETDGGVAPGAGCDAGSMVEVPYSAEYYFYGP